MTLARQPGIGGAVSAALDESDPAIKSALVAAIDGPAAAEALAEVAEVTMRRAPGRPERPLLVAPRDVPHRGLGTPAGRAALVHAVAHIEFNAINLALDACCRFRNLPPEYYADWLRVAGDEARHFSMLEARLRQLGYAYGNLPAHNGLWEAAEKTAGDPLLRMALVPRVLEARGLDVTPGMIGRLREVGDAATVAILEVILHDEVEHVRVGSAWFRYLCARRGLDAPSTFLRLLDEHGVRVRPPFNTAARLAAGFVPEEFGGTG